MGEKPGICDAVAAAETEGRYPARPAEPAKRVQKRGQNARAACANRMAERDGASLNVDPSGIEAELTRHRNGLHRERLVQLDQVDVGQ